MSRNSFHPPSSTGSSSGPFAANPTNPATRVSDTVSGLARGSSAAGYTPGGRISLTALIVVRSSSGSLLPTYSLTALPGFVDLFVDPRNFTQPDMPLVVLHVQDVVERPVKVIRDVGYLLVNLLQGVACYPPWPAAPPPPRRSTSNSVWHEGHLAWTFGAPS